MIYIFRCMNENCLAYDDVVERLCKLDEKPVCETCKQDTLKKQITSAYFSKSNLGSWRKGLGSER